MLNKGTNGSFLLNKRTLECAKDMVHLFSQPISVHITEENTLCVVDCGLGVIRPVIPLLKLRVRDRHC